MELLIHANQFLSTVATRQAILSSYRVLQISHGQHQMLPAE